MPERLGSGERRESASDRLVGDVARPGTSLGRSGSRDLRSPTSIGDLEPNEGEAVTEMTTDEAQDEERSDLELAIAEQLALLSQSNEVPSEIEPPGDSFQAEDIDFSSPDWMSSLATV